MEKVILDDNLWRAVFEAAIRFTGDESLRLPVKIEDRHVAVPLSLQEAIRLRKKVDEIHKHRLRKYDDKVFYWLTEQSDDEQDEAIFQLHQEGIILDPDKVYRRLSDWYRNESAGNAQPKEAEKMSDDVLDRFTQYVHINRDLFDDPEMFAEEYIH